jgi:hypothetical protein
MKSDRKNKNNTHTMLSILSYSSIDNKALQNNHFKSEV